MKELVKNGSARRCLPAVSTDLRSKDVGLKIKVNCVPLKKYRTY